MYSSMKLADSVFSRSLYAASIALKRSAARVISAGVNGIATRALGEHRFKAALVRHLDRRARYTSFVRTCRRMANTR